MSLLYAYAIRDNDIVEVEKLTIPVTSPSVQYGIGMFEGIMAYPAPGGVWIIALKEHLHRMWESAKRTPFKLVPPISEEEAFNLIVALCKKNGVDRRAYLRPCFYHQGTGDILPNTAFDGGCHFAVYVQKWDFYLPPGRGMRCTISPVSKPRSPLASIKMSANYASAIDAKGEAMSRGFDEAILLDANGDVAEGSTENLVIAWKGKLIEPEFEGAPILPGITNRILRERIAPSLGLNIERVKVSLSMLREADGILLTGTAAEVTHVTELDGLVYNQGAPTAEMRALIDGYQSVVGGSSHTDLLTVVATV